MDAWRAGRRAIHAIRQLQSNAFAPSGGRISRGKVCPRVCHGSTAFALVCRCVLSRVRRRDRPVLALDDRARWCASSTHPATRGPCRCRWNGSGNFSFEHEELSALTLFNGRQRIGRIEHPTAQDTRRAAEGPSNNSPAPVLSSSTFPGITARADGVSRHARLRRTRADSSTSNWRPIFTNLTSRSSARRCWSTASRPAGPVALRDPPG